MNLLEDESGIIQHDGEDRDGWGVEEDPERSMDGGGGGGVGKSMFERAFQSAGDCQISCQNVEDAFSAK